MLILIVKAGVLAAAAATGAACVLYASGIRADLLDRTQAIHRAAMRGDVVEVCECRAKGVDPDVPTTLKRTSLHYAAYLGRTAVVEVLLAAGSNCSLTDYRGASPLHYAAAGGHTDACRLLLDAGAQVNSRTLRRLTPLHLAAQLGMARTVELLVAFGADVDAVDREGSTPLMLAVWPDMWEAFVEDLVFRGSWAEPGEQAQKRRVLLELAQAGADLQARNRDGLTARDLAVRSKIPGLMNTLHALSGVTRSGRRAAPPPPARRTLVALSAPAGVFNRQPAAGQRQHAAAAPAPAGRAAALAAAAAAAVQCVVCMEHPRVMACLPCGHMAYCVECMRALNDHNLRQCCICRGRVTSIHRIYQA